MKELERENRELRRANEILKSAAAFFGAELDRRSVQVTAYVDAHRTAYGVEPICRTLAIAPSSLLRGPEPDRRPPARSATRPWPTSSAASTRVNFGVYGIRKVWKALGRLGIDAGRDQVARIMRNVGLQGVTRHQRIRTTRPAAVGAAPGRPRRAGVRGRRSQPSVGGRPSPTCGPSAGSCTGLRGRRLQPPDRRLAGELEPAGGARPRRARDGGMFRAGPRSHGSRPPPSDRGGGCPSRSGTRSASPRPRR